AGWLVQSAVLVMKSWRPVQSSRVRGRPPPPAGCVNHSVDSFFGYVPVGAWMGGLDGAMYSCLSRASAARSEDPRAHTVPTL
ncbi:MAG: hypothetical protein ACLP3C_00090, partial [Mycobacterium sp.]|uniref:hypothetical protein n=1 Tax=Mycobacterium sp. TaxID=1785 RepID=UPI003F99B93B